MEAVLALITALLPQLGVTGANADLIGKIIAALVALIPTVIQEAKDLLPAVKNIIAALSANPATTADQLAALDALDAQVDAAFEAAAAAATAEDAQG